MDEAITKSPYVINVGEGEEETSILQLMKKKWGITKSSPFTIKNTDSLYTTYRKLAKNIYKNGEWTEKEKEEAVRDIFSEYNYKDPEQMRIRKLSKEEITDLKTRIQPVRDTPFLETREIYLVNLTQLLGNNKEISKDQYISIDPENKISKRPGRVLNYPRWLLKEDFRENNMDLTIGFSRLKRDVKRYYNDLPENKKNNLSYLQVEKLLWEFEDKRMGGKANQNIFLYNTIADFDPEKYPYPKSIKRAKDRNRVLDFYQSYLDDTYNIILQNEYQKDQDKQLKASPWENKKNINASTIERMKNSPLKQYYSAVEFDNSVELEALSVFEKELMKVQSLLPDNKNNGHQPEMHLRMLGNYRASGMYVPPRLGLPTGAIALDFRNGITDGNEIAVKRLKSGGIKSFIHEYGHSLDFANGQLSLQAEFTQIVTAYRHNFDQTVTNDWVIKMKNYFQTPTEVFARAFELYVSDAKLDSLLIHEPRYYQNAEEYQVFTPEMRVDLTRFFDKEFPDFKKKIESYNLEPIQTLPLAQEQTVIGDNMEKENNVEPSQNEKDLKDIPESIVSLKRGVVKEYSISEEFKTLHPDEVRAFEEMDVDIHRLSLSNALVLEKMTDSQWKIMVETVQNLSKFKNITFINDFTNEKFNSRKKIEKYFEDYREELIKVNQEMENTSEITKGTIGMNTSNQNTNVKRTTRQIQNEAVRELGNQAKHFIMEAISSTANFEDFRFGMSEFPALSPRNLALVLDQQALLPNGEASLIGNFAQLERLGKNTGLSSQNVTNVTRTIRVAGKDPVKKEINYLTITPGERSKITLLDKKTDQFFFIKQEDGTQIRHWEKYWNADEKALVKSGKIKALKDEYYIPKKVFDISQTNIKGESLELILPYYHTVDKKDVNVYHDKLLSAYQKGINNLYKASGVEPGSSNEPVTLNYFTKNPKFDLSIQEANFASELVELHFRGNYNLTSPQLALASYQNSDDYHDYHDYHATLLKKTDKDVINSLSRVQRAVKDAVGYIEHSVKPEYTKLVKQDRAQKRADENNKVVQKTNQINMGEPVIVR